MSTPVFGGGAYPSGVITLITDFGQRDPFVGVMKGRILTRWPEAKIVDLTHEILVHWPAEAGFWLARSYRDFPRGTVHVAVVDPGVGTQRNIVAVEADGHIFLAPDNGLLAPITNRVPNHKIYRLDLTRLGHLGLGTPSATFHGRDIFAPLAAEIAAGRLRPHSLGPELTELVPGWTDEPEVSEGQVSGVVITIDHFGNLVTNIDVEHVRLFLNPVVRTGNHEFPLRRTYGDMRPGEYLALINAFDVVEIARAEQSTAEGLGLGRGARVVIRES
ncbi:MAG: SAM-dependent chlorinase/fluorinase [Candidatus Obscuribacterales bacterium]|nr:SAM-dependent chlorinase/fluorinase [Steroidobacteraceae bacterium]